LHLRILIAETDLVLLAEMRQALEGAGHTVITSTDGMGAWDHLVSTSPPDLLVTRCDLGPGMPPGTALGLRAQSSHPRIPVIYIPGSIERAEHVDPQHGTILVKPFSVADLVATVKLMQGTIDAMNVEAVATLTAAHSILSMLDGDANHARP
jgi:DNA-binding response OmpR family regulator